MDEPLSYAAFSKDVEFIRGANLQRFLHDPARSKQLRPGFEWYWVYTPTDNMQALRCDDCAKRHNPRNLNCSATLGVESKAVDPGLLYPFHAIDNKAGRRRAVCLNFVNYGRREAVRGCVVQLGMP